MYTIIITMAIVLIPLIGLQIYRLIKKEMNWNNWKRDIRTMSTNYVDSRNNINQSNSRLTELNRSYKNETNPQERARLFGLAIKQHTEGEILWAEHDMNHTATYNAIKEKYIKD